MSKGVGAGGRFDIFLDSGLEIRKVQSRSSISTTWKELLLCYLKEIINSFLSR